MEALEQISRLADVPLRLEVEVDRRAMPVSEILDWKVGSLIVMKRSAGENVDIYVAGVRIGAGEILIVDNTMAVRITNLEDRS
ncbi:MAG TPA: FliM/FliN family flagellar motor switch protein [Bryobacteraceae bacterium]|nr:FliM/FliN family flagellar motor switch protein [Bryobacteraceae bacterium]